jgi:hypothetical protein
MYSRPKSGFGGWADEKINTAREAAPILSRKKSHPQHLTISHLKTADGIKVNVYVALISKPIYDTRSFPLVLAASPLFCTVD